MNHNKNEISLKYILEVTDRLSATPTATVNLGLVEGWMKSDDLEVLCATVGFLLDEKFGMQVQPPPSYWDVTDFFLMVWKRVISENNIKSDRIPSRYDVATQLGQYFESRWLAGDKIRDVPKIRETIEQFYMSGDTEVRTCLETATIEHLMEKRDIREYLNDWKQHPIMKHAFANCLEWALAHERD